MNPTPGKRYRHHKGNLYEVIAVSGAFSASPLADRASIEWTEIKSLWAIDADDLDVYSCYRYGDLVWVCDENGNYQTEPVVIYRAVVKPEHNWSRKLSSWLQPLDDGAARFVEVE